MHITNRVAAAFLEERDEEPGIHLLSEGVGKGLHFAGKMPAQCRVAAAHDDEACASQCGGLL